MTRVIIIGAGGSLVPCLIEELQKKADIKLTLFLRNKAKLDQANIGNCNIIEGDVFDYHVLKAAIHGQDIVYINLAGNLEAMAVNIVNAMKETNVQRVIAISSIGIYEKPLRPVLLPYRKLADVIENSGLVYTVLRPNWFTSGREIDYAITHKGEPEKGTAVSRKSIASFVASVIENPALYQNENLGISKLI